MGHPIHHLELQVRRCQVQVRLNGMSLGRVVATGRRVEVFSPPVNPLLVGEDNQLELALAPLVDEQGRPEPTDSARVGLALVRHESGGIVDLGAGERPFSARVEYGGDLAPRVERVSFDSEGPSFANLLRDRAPLDDEQGLLDYALRLSGLAAAGDVAALLDEMEAKIADYARAYDEREAALRASLELNLREMFALELLPEVEREELVLEPHAGGRVWELGRSGGRGLIATQPDADGATSDLRVFVAQREQGLGVVR